MKAAPRLTLVFGNALQVEIPLLATANEYVANAVVDFGWFHIKALNVFASGPRFTKF